MKKVFDFEQLHNFKSGGVYIIYKVDPNKKEEVVKIGESDFILRRLANYLTEFKTRKARLKSSRATKKRIIDGIKKYKKDGCKFYVNWIIVEDRDARKKLERKLIDDFVIKYKRIPLFHVAKK